MPKKSARNVCGNRLKMIDSFSQLLWITLHIERPILLGKKLSKNILRGRLFLLKDSIQWLYDETSLHSSLWDPGFWCKHSADACNNSNGKKWSKKPFVLSPQVVWQVEDVIFYYATLTHYADTAINLGLRRVFPHCFVDWSSLISTFYFSLASWSKKCNVQIHNNTGEKQEVWQDWPIFAQSQAKYWCIPELVVLWLMHVFYARPWNIAEREDAMK